MTSKNTKYNIIRREQRKNLPDIPDDVPIDQHGTLNGYTYYNCRCDECCNAGKNYRIKNETQIKERIYIKRVGRKEFALKYLGGKCVICGTDDNLEFDHKDYRTKIKCISNFLLGKLELLILELDKCQLLCKICHRVKSNAEETERKTKGLVHGTLTGYTKYKCRCDECKKACAISNKKHRADTETCTVYTRMYRKRKKIQLVLDLICIYLSDKIKHQEITGEIK